MYKIITYITLFLGVFIVPVEAAEIGTSAPAFDVKDIAGETQSLAQYKGRIVVLEWNNPQCPFVKKHYDSGNMQGVQKYAVDHGIVWLTVNSGAPGKQGDMDAAAAKAKVAEVGGHENAYILDPEGKLGILYGAKTTPHMFVIDRKGMLAYAGAIDDAPTPDPQDVKTAHNYVRMAIDDLMASRPVKVASSRAYGCSVKYRD